MGGGALCSQFPKTNASHLLHGAKKYRTQSFFICPWGGGGRSVNLLCHQICPRENWATFIVAIQNYFSLKITFLSLLLIAVVIKAGCKENFKKVIFASLLSSIENDFRNF